MYLNTLMGIHWLLCWTCENSNYILCFKICAALTEMFKVPETEALVSAMFPKLMSAVMLRMGSCLGVKVGKDIDSKGQKNKKEQNPSLSPIRSVVFLVATTFNCLPKMEFSLQIATHKMKANYILSRWVFFT